MPRAGPEGGGGGGGGGAMSFESVKSAIAFEALVNEVHVYSMQVLWGQ